MEKTDRLDMVRPYVTSGRAQPGRLFFVHVPKGASEGSCVLLFRDEAERLLASLTAALASRDDGDFDE